MAQELSKADSILLEQLRNGEQESLKEIFNSYFNYLAIWQKSCGLDGWCKLTISAWGGQALFQHFFHGFFDVLSIVNVVIVPFKRKYLIYGLISISFF